MILLWKMKFWVTLSRKLGIPLKFFLFSKRLIASILILISLIVFFSSVETAWRYLLYIFTISYSLSWGIMEFGFKRYDLYD